MRSDSRRQPARVHGQSRREDQAAEIHLLAVCCRFARPSSSFGVSRDPKAGRRIARQCEPPASYMTAAASNVRLRGRRRKTQEITPKTGQPPPFYGDGLRAKDASNKLVKVPIVE